ncbi:MAG TPA: helicase C-terminal domain-containing protein [Ktedonobacteraceae bacterium]|nr:helicase C-terminal domain-containing protein [Ktedonobacteraceae bacterium]
MEEGAPSQIGQFAIIRLLRDSLFESVYLGKQQGRAKNYSTIHVYHTLFATDEQREAFLLQAKSLKKLKHRNIAELIDYGLLPNAGQQQSTQGYVVTQYVSEKSMLEHFLPGTRYQPDEVKRVLSPIADALQYAHASRIYHHNLHPGSILIDESRQFLLTGFSPLATQHAQQQQTVDPDALLYQAPEWLQGNPGPASDQYALGVMVYAWLCGRRPYSASGRDALLQQQLHEPLPAPRSLNDAISPAVEQVILTALAPNPDERFPRPQAFSSEYLRALMGFSGPPIARTQHDGQNEVISKHTSTGHIDKIGNVEAQLSAPIVPDSPSLAPEKARDASEEHELEPLPADDAPDEDELESEPEQETPRPQPRRFSTGSIANLGDIVTADLSQDGVLSQRLDGYEERSAQVEMAQQVAKALIEEKHAVIEASTGTGKALDVDTPIPTPAGWKRMGDLVAGDYVFDDKGYPTRVTVAFDIMHDHNCYEVLFSDGSSLIADAEHEWVSYTALDRQWHKRPRSNVYEAKNFVTLDKLLLLEQIITLSSKDSVLSIDEAVELIGGHRWSIYQAARQIAPVNSNMRPARYPLLALLATVKDRLAKDLVEQHRDKRAYTLVTTEQMAATLAVGSTPRANHAIAVADSLKLPEVSLPIAPYFLGVWLGDGSSYSNQITAADPAIIPEIEKDGYTVRSLKSHPYLYAVDDEMGKAVSRWQPGMTGRLRALGLLLNKHIPAIYLRSSEQQRRALLAGLLDTDGTVSHTGAIEFTTTSPRLAEGVFELACSLGFRPALRNGRARLKQKDCGPKWTLSFTSEQQVFRLPRKTVAQQERLHNYTPGRNRFRYVIEVHEVPTRPVRCIQVDSKSHLYLAGRSMIPTHNSLAYLLPIVRSGRGAIISTANKALQEQLFYKDIPFIKKNVQNFDAALVKGVGNYICLDRLEDERKGLGAARNSDFSRLLNVVQEFELTISGDFETLGFPVPGDLMHRVNADRDQCSWTECKYFKQCYVREMKKKAEEAQVIVVNHTLLLLDAASGGFVLPQREAVVVDEAHHLEEEATRAFTISVNQSQVYALLALKRLQSNSSAELQQTAKGQLILAWERLAQVADPGYKGRANLRAPLEEGLKLATTIEKLAGSLEKQRPLFLIDKEEILYKKLIDRTRTLAKNIRFVFSVAQAEKYVYYVERIAARRGNISPLEVSAAPLDVTEWLKKHLFDRTHVISTSATLTTVGPNPHNPKEHGPSFAYFRNRAGLDYINYPDAIESMLPLTFDYERNSLLYLPRHLPLPVYGDEEAAIGYTKAIAGEMLSLVRASRGRAFLLFSSKRMLNDVYQEFLTRLAPNEPLRLLSQEDRSMTRLELVREFRESEGAVLFGLKSFWEGVDIAGEALSLVVIDKLPFDPPDDPVQEARVALMKKNGENWFGSYVLPQAVLRLKQGLGRLLRTREDRGVMAILDARLHKKNYGKLVIDALPPARRAYDIRDVERFFEEGGDEVPF